MDRVLKDLRAMTGLSQKAFGEWLHIPARTIEEWEIIPKQKIPGHRSFLPAHYTADFKYMRDGVLHVEDVKSTYTREDQAYILRRKLMYLVHEIYVEEVVR